jgi:hypothetical protein
MGSVCHVKSFATGLTNYLQGRLKAADDVQQGVPVATAIQATVQQMKELIRADRRIMIDSAATALGCFHGLA